MLVQGRWIQGWYSRAARLLCASTRILLALLLLLLGAGARILFALLFLLVPFVPVFCLFVLLYFLTVRQSNIAKAARCDRTLGKLKIRLTYLANAPMHRIRFKKGSKLVTYLYVQV